MRNESMTTNPGKLSCLDDAQACRPDAHMRGRLAALLMESLNKCPDVMPAKASIH